MVRIRMISIKEDPFLKIWLKSRPEKGRANRELSRLLKKLFGEYSFISGATSRGFAPKRVIFGDFRSKNGSLGASMVK
ncbi:MAG: DUF167 domain-containing protein [Candidatus Aenigmarchaeota archaeon]|nr:DUF167 domain-containing protein [Candidatus Aenigmarchaeota archaeon]